MVEVKPNDKNPTLRSEGKTTRYFVLNTTMNFLVDHPYDPMIFQRPPEMRAISARIDDAIDLIRS